MLYVTWGLIICSIVLAAALTIWPPKLAIWKLGFLAMLSGFLSPIVGIVLSSFIAEGIVMVAVGAMPLFLVSCAFSVAATRRILIKGGRDNWRVTALLWVAAIIVSAAAVAIEMIVIVFVSWVGTLAFLGFSLLLPY